MTPLPRPSVLLVTAEARTAVTGNATTADRYARGLAARGLPTTLLRLPDHPAPEDVVAVAQRTRPSVVHAIHARHAGPAAVVASRASGAPLVVTSGGTDLDQDLFVPARAAVVRGVLAAASALLVHHPEARDAARALGLPLAVLLVPKGVEVPPRKAPPDPARFGAGEDDLVLALPAGVRPVKNNRFAVALAARLHAEGFPVRLVLAGATRDEAYAAALRGDLARAPCATWPGPLAPDDLEALYATASVVLNVSHSEGGSNALLEAMARGVAVLASDVPGNRRLLAAAEDRAEAGWLYRTAPSGIPGAPAHDLEDASRRLRALLTSPVLRQRLGAAARERVALDHDPEAEVDGVLAAYRVALAPR